MSYIVERTIAKDTIVIRHGRTFDILAIRTRRPEGYRWASNNPKIQAICDEWGGGSTAEALARMIMQSLTKGSAS